MHIALLIFGVLLIGGITFHFVRPDCTDLVLPLWRVENPAWNVCVDDILRLLVHIDFLVSTAHQEGGEQYPKHGLSSEVYRNGQRLIACNRWHLSLLILCSATNNVNSHG